MAGIRKTKFEALKATETWGNLLRKTDFLATDVSKQEIYKTKPVDLHTFVTSPDYLGQDFFGGLSQPQHEFVDNLSDLENGLTYFVLVVGKGGGKNFTCQVAFLYIVYNLLCMYDANTYLKHPKNKPITLMNMAINANQALDNFFEPLTTIVRSAGQKAFKDFGFNPNTDIFKDYVVFPQNIQIISTHSQAGGVEGYDILVGMIDECDDAEFHGVNRAIDTLRSSSDSRFKKKGKVAVISYIRYEGSSGKIMEEYERAQGHSHIYAQKYASWDFNPNLTKDDFKNKFDENPEKAACIYGSEFSGSFVDSWIKDYKRIKNSMNITRPSLINFPLPYDPDEIGSLRWLNKMAHSEWRSKAMSEHTYTTKEDEVVVLDPYDIPLRYFGNPSYKYIFVGDPALGSEQNGGDGYGVCLAHRETVVIDGVKYIRPIIDFVFRFTGRMFKEGQVQMESVRKLIYKLKSEYGFNIKIFSFDGWNSADTTQWLAKTYPGSVIYEKNIVEIEDYTALRDAIFGESPPTFDFDTKGKLRNDLKAKNGGIDIPWHPVLYEELRNLREDKAKKKVDHPSTGSIGKDMADTVAKAVNILVYKYPLMEVLSAGVEKNHQSLVNKVSQGIATTQEQKTHTEQVNSKLFGLGNRFKPQQGVINLYGTTSRRKEDFNG